MIKQISTERGRDGKTDRQRERQTGRQTDIITEGGREEKNGERMKERGPGEKERQTDRDRQTD